MWCLVQYLFISNSTTFDWQPIKLLWLNHNRFVKLTNWFESVSEFFFSPLALCLVISCSSGLPEIVWAGSKYLKIIFNLVFVRSYLYLCTLKSLEITWYLSWLLVQDFDHSLASLYWLVSRFHLAHEKVTWKAILGLKSWNRDFSFLVFFKPFWALASAGPILVCAKICLSSTSLTIC